MTDARVEAFLADILALEGEADCDPHARKNHSDVQVAVATARAALAKYQAADIAQRRAFLFLLLFKVRPDKSG